MFDGMNDHNLDGGIAPGIAPGIDPGIDPGFDGDATGPGPASGARTGQNQDGDMFGRAAVISVSRYAEITGQTARSVREQIHSGTCPVHVVVLRHASAVAPARYGITVASVRQLLGLTCG